MKSATADILYGVAVLLIALALYAHTFNDVYQFNPLIESVSTVFFSRILMAAIALCSLALIAKGVRSKAGEYLPEINTVRVILVFITAAVTSAGIWFIGFFYAMPIGVFVTGWFLGYRRMPTLPVVSLIAPLLVWVALAHFAGVSFPTDFRLN